MDTRHLFKPSNANTYYVAVDVPKPLRAALGCKRLKKALGMDSLREANRLKGRVVSEFKDRIERARLIVSGTDPVRVQALMDREALRAAEMPPQAWSAPLDNHPAENVAETIRDELLIHAATMHHVENRPADARRYMTLATTQRGVLLADLTEQWFAVRAKAVGRSVLRNQRRIVGAFIK